MTAPRALPPEPPVGTVLSYPLGGGGTGLVVSNPYGWLATGSARVMTWVEVNDYEGLELVSRPDMPAMVDPAGMRWRWVEAGYLREEEPDPLSPEQLAVDFEAVEVKA